MLGQAASVVGALMKPIMYIIILIAIGVAFLLLGTFAMISIAMIGVGILMIYQKRVKIGGILAIIGFIILIVMTLIR